MLLNKYLLILAFSAIIFTGCSADKETPDLKEKK